jgi:hypothetical protein
MHKTFGTVWLAAFALAGCADPTTVEKRGSNTYLVRTHVLGTPLSGTDVQAKNLQVATDICAKAGRSMTIIDRVGYSGLAAQDQLTFRCDPAARATQPRAGS